MAVTEWLRARHNRAFFSLALGGLGLVAIGCGSGASQPADPTLARQVLVEVLDSWKKGDPPDASLHRSPPVRVTDEEWVAGARLLDYRVEADGRDIVGEQSFPLTLTLENKGRKLTRKVEDHVVTDPTLAVFRQE